MTAWSSPPVPLVTRARPSSMRSVRAMARSPGRRPTKSPPFAYDGVVLAPNGDLIVGDFRNLTRIRVADGTTAWRVPRLCSINVTCGAATDGEAAYVIDFAAPRGLIVVRFDLATGARAQRHGSLSREQSLRGHPRLEEEHGGNRLGYRTGSAADLHEPAGPPRQRGRRHLHLPDLPLNSGRVA